MLNSLNILAILTLLPISNTIAQEISTHQWKNRIILILAEDPNLDIYQDQLDEFRRDLNGMKERKLITYQIFPTEYHKGLAESDSYKSSEIFYEKFKQTEASFEVVLIGLDGGIKLRQRELLTTEKLFAIIDAMPMRRAELRKNKQNDN